MKISRAKYFISSIILLAICACCFAQKEFFRSQQIFKKGQLDKFSSSITFYDSTILFNANDYHLYSYNKYTGSHNWSYKNNYKSSVPVFVINNIIYAGASKNDIQNAVQISMANGALIKTLPFGPLQTKPIIKNGILYCTAIYNFGCIIAYHLEKDTIIWSRFIAHGFSRQPYYSDNKILANAEGDSWVELGYDGLLLDTTCTIKASIFVEGIPCVKTFAILTHQGVEIKGKLADSLFLLNFNEEPDIIATKIYTYVLSSGQLSIISTKLKLLYQVNISSLMDELPESGPTKLLKVADDYVWLQYANHILQYNHKTKKIFKATSFTAWQPQQILLDGDNIWLISGKDGLLYGLTM